MSIWIKGNNKASRLFIGGKDIKKAYYNGDLIFRKGIPCYGWMTYLDTNSSEIIKQPITVASDYNRLFSRSRTSSPTANLAFSFATIPVGNITAWEFNLDPDSSYVTNQIPNNFLTSFNAINCDITIPSWVTAVGDDFIRSDGNTLGNNMIFNGKIDLANVKTIGSNFLISSTTFNKALNLNKIESIGSSFLQSTVFNQELNLPSLVTASDILNGNSVFNRPITIGSNCTNIGSILYGLSGGKNMNSTITIESETCTIGSILGQNYSTTTARKQWSKPFTFKPDWDITGIVFNGLDGDQNNAIVINCELNPDRIIYNEESFSFRTTMYTNHDGTFVRDGNACFVFTGTYANEMKAKFPDYYDTTGSGGNSYRKSIVQ